MKHVLRKMSVKGDAPVCEWDTDTVTPERLVEIEAEFTAMQKQGFFAADIGKNELIHEFDPNADILMMPRLQGG